MEQFLEILKHILTLSFILLVLMYLTLLISKRTTSQNKKAGMSKNIGMNNIDRIFLRFVLVTDIDSEYDAAYELYMQEEPEKVEESEAIDHLTQNMIKVEPLREIIKSINPSQSEQLFDNPEMLDDVLRVIAIYARENYIDAEKADETERRAAIVFNARLWKLAMLSKIDIVRELWKEYDDKYCADHPDCDIAELQTKVTKDNT